MDDEDFQAVCELASEMTVFEAARFIRSQTGHGIGEAYQIAKKVARDLPKSKLAKDFKLNSPLSR